VWGGINFYYPRALAIYHWAKEHYPDEIWENEEIKELEEKLARAK